MRWDLLLYFTAVTLPGLLLAACFHLPDQIVTRCLIAVPLASVAMIVLVVRRTWSVLGYRSLWIALLLVVLQAAGCVMWMFVTMIVLFRTRGFEGIH